MRDADEANAPQSRDDEDHVVPSENDAPNEGVGSHADQSNPETTNTDRVHPPRRRRGLRVVLFLLILATVCVWAAPIVVAHTPMRQRVLPWLFPDLNARTEVGAASLGWFSPVVARDVRIEDADENAIAQIGRIVGDRPLWRHVWNPQRCGRFRIENASARIRVRSDGSNLEDVLAKYFKPSDAAPFAIEYTVEIVDAHVTILRAESTETTELTDLDVTITQPCAAMEPLTVLASTTAVRSNDAASAGRVAVSIKWTPNPIDSNQWGSGEIVVDSDGFPTGTLEPVFVRLGSDLQLAGASRGRITFAWSDVETQPSASLFGDATVEGLVVSGALAAGADAVRMRSVQLAGRADVFPDRIEFVDVALDSDAADVRFVGVVDAGVMRESAWINRFAALAGDQDFACSAHVDLAELSAVMPGTIRVRPGTELTSGALTASVNSGVRDGARRWTAEVKTTDVIARDRKRTIAWKEPVTLNLAARRTPDGVTLDRVECTSDFLNLTGGGTLDDAEIVARCDLDRLARHLHRFFDFSDNALAGRVDGRFRLKRTAPQQLACAGDLRFSDFQLQLPNRAPWRETRLDVQAAAKGDYGPSTADGKSGGRLTRLTSARVRVVGGNDRLDAALTGPVDLTANAVRWPLSVDVAGELADWAARLQPWVALGNRRVSGRVDLKAKLTMSENELVIDQAVVDAADLRFVGDGLFVTDRKVHIETEGRWDFTRRTVESKLTTWASTTASVRADEFRMELFANGPPRLEGRVAFRAGVREISRWFKDPATDPGVQLSGIASGRVRFVQEQSVTAGDWNLDVKDFAAVAPAASSRTVADPLTGRFDSGRTTNRNAFPMRAVPASTRTTTTLWTEPKLSLSGRGAYNHARDQLRVSTASIDSEAGELTASGTIDEPTGRMIVDVAGAVDYDAGRLINALRLFTGDGVRLTGRERRKFSLKGPLFHSSAQTAAADSPTPAYLVSAELEAQAGLGWQTADVYGLVAGAGKVDARLSEGVVRIAPLDVAVGEGRVTGSPRILLNANRPMLVLEPGSVVENVALSRELCRSWLGYVAPALAESTDVAGRFSMSVASAQVPLLNPSTGALSGDLTIHEARVRPGPLMQRFVGLARQIQTLFRSGGGGADDRDVVTMPEQNVAYEMKNGRVFHRGLTFEVRGVMIRTEGSVGFDETLAMTAYIPIQDGWVQGNRVFSGMKGREIEVPIRGTITRPQIDARVLSNLAAQAAEGAAGRFLEDNLGNQLNRLLRDVGRNKRSAVPAR